jgi:hypothetical protein
MVTKRGERLELADVRPVRRGASRLRVVGGSGRVDWWHPRLALGLTLFGMLLGALVGVTRTILDGVLTPVVALEAYGAGGGFGAAVGLLAGLVLGLFLGLADRYVLPQAVRPARVWVRYRRER